MMRDYFKLISGGIAVGIYLLLAGMILYYFNYKNRENTVHYVVKNTDTIAVSLAGPPKEMLDAKGKKKSIPAKHKPKKIRNITAPKKAIQKSRKSKKIAKKVQTKHLFASVKTAVPPHHKPSKKIQYKAEKLASQRVAESLKKSKNRDKGIENRYFASVEEKLRGWPAQANYAGEQISVWLKIFPSGSFEFKIQKLSANNEFNEALITYLKQLQTIGLGRHHNSKPYQIEVSFEATE